MVTSKTVLLVEDDEDILAFVEMLLSEEGYTVRLAHDGQEGLKIIREQRPAVILLDLGLPGMSAREFAERVRGEFGPGLPIVILSAGRDLDKRVEEVGAQDFLAKPFDVGDLVAKVEKWTATAGPPAA